MATIRKLKNGYRVQLYLSPTNRPSATFSTQRECKEWARDQTIRTRTPAKKVTFSDAMDRYLKEVSPNKKGKRWDEIRIKAFQRDEKPLCDKLLGDITKADITQWRNKRAATGVSDATIRREWTLLSSIFNTAIQEWGWITENPMRLAKRPPAPPPRERLISDEEIEKMEYVTGYTIDSELLTVTQRVCAAMHFALETAMRAQEICFLRWNEISGRVAKVSTSKTRSGIREVPLSKTAMNIIKRLKAVNENKETVFDITPTQLDALFRKARKNAGLDGFTFHDSRATAITRLSKKLDIMDLAKMIGHKNLSMLMVYYREGAEELAEKLD